MSFQVTLNSALTGQPTSNVSMAQQIQELLVKKQNGNITPSDLERQFAKLLEVQKFRTEFPRHQA